MTTRIGRPLRVLHVLTRLDTGGVENWLLELLRRVPAREQEWTFLVHASEPGCHEAEVTRLGGRILRTCEPHHLAGYALRLRAILAERPGFDVIHSHLHLLSGFILSLADGHVPIRIAHAHNAGEGSGGPLRRVYRRCMRLLLRRHVTHALAASQAAGSACFGASGPRFSVLPCGIDLTPFSLPGASPALRAQLGIPAGALVVAHVARFVAEKNHQRLLEIIEQARLEQVDAHAVLVGDGPLLPSVRAEIEARGLSGCVHCLGKRSDVAALLQMSDRFLFPSLHEGLGLACVEAQACGLAVVMNESLPPEATVVPELVQRLPLSAPNSAWVAALRRPTRVEKGLALATVTQSAFNIDSGLASLGRLYQAGT